MKYFIISIISVLVLSANLVSALDYNEQIDYRNTTGVFTLPSSRISEAKLLATYIQRYQKNINQLALGSPENENIALKTANIKLKEMLTALTQIQSGAIEETLAVQMMQNIVKDIKVLNTRMKVYTEQELIMRQEEIKKQQKKYTVIGKKISILLDTLIEDISSPLLKKSILSENEKSIVRSLVIIREENKKIKIFGSKSFTSQGDMKFYFQDIIQNIRTEIKNMKKLRFS